MLTNEQLVELYQKGDEEALNKLLMANKGLLYKIAYKIKLLTMKDHIDVEDLIQEGYLALIINANTFDTTKGFKFTTYAFKGVYQRMYRFIYGTSSREKGNAKLNDCTSLNTPIGENNDMELEDTLEDPTDFMEEVERKLYIDKLHQDLLIAMNEVNTPQEIKALKYRYINNKTYEEIGALLGVSRNRARDIEARALRQLRKAKILKRYKPTPTNLTKPIFVNDNIKKLLDRMKADEEKFISMFG